MNILALPDFAERQNKVLDHTHTITLEHNHSITVSRKRW